MSDKSAYLGNQNLKRSNVQIQFTPEQVGEYVKCAQDPIYFIQTYVKIINVDKGLINFSLYDYQQDIINLAQKERFVICKMPRQCGKTTTIAGYMLWLVLFQENFSIAILANKLQQAREILSRVQLAYEHLPKWLQQGIVEWNKGNLELENGSKILASATSSSAIRGTSQNLVYLDEFAFVPNNMQEEFFSSVYPTISSGQTTRVLITSTPNGLNMFYKIWHDSEENHNNYKRIDVHWSDVPGRDEKWKQETIRNTSEEQFRVEFECDFVGSSATLISGAKLRKLTYMQPIEQSEHIKIYLPPLARRSYVQVVDTSRGVGLDYSASVVFDVTELPYRVVATFRSNKVQPVVFPHFIQQLGRRYNNALTLVETNDLGQQVVDILHGDLEYEEIVSCAIMGRAGQQITPGFGQASHKGVKTTKQVKRIGCSQLKTLIELDKLFINDFQILYELTRFALKGQSYEAEEGNDDMVMCCVLFAWMSSQPYFKELTNIDIRAKLYDEESENIDNELMMFGLFDNGEVDDPSEVKTVAYDEFDVWMRS